MEYDFELVHISGKKNGRADALSRRPDYSQGEEDNRNLVVIPPNFFSKIYARLAGSEEANPQNKREWERYVAGINPDQYQTIQEMVEEDQQNTEESQKRIHRWTNTHQLIQITSIWWKDNRIVVAGDNNLKRGVIQFFHDTLGWTPRNFKYVPTGKTQLLVA